MSHIKKDIELYMVGPTIADSVIMTSFVFPEEFIGFQGHFPAKPVLPGACQIQCALSSIEKALNSRVVLKEIVLAKYIAPVFPGDNVTCAVSGALEAGADLVCKVRITKGAEKVAEMKLRVLRGEGL